MLSEAEAEADTVSTWALRVMKPEVPVAHRLPLGRPAGRQADRQQQQQSSISFIKRLKAKAWPAPTHYALQRAERMRGMMWRDLSKLRRGRNGMIE